MTSFRHPLLPALLLVAAMLSGCATGTTYLEMSRTAGFVGARPTKVNVVNIEGTDAGSFQEELYEVLSKDRHFTIKPYGVTPPQSPDSATSVPSIILSGIHSTQEDTRYFSEGKEGDKKHYTETTESHEFQYSILDAVTGEELDANVVRQENVSKEEDNDGSIFDAVVEEVLEEVVKDLWGVESDHREELIRSFVAVLLLHPEKRSIGLFKDNDIPELKEGVELVEKGDLPAAIARFQAGAESHPESEALHKAYFNLGVAFEYNNEFDKALASFRLADELGPEQGYAAEIDHCRRFARQYRWQHRYARSSSGVPSSVHERRNK